jgi:hypothetical protein
MTTLSRVVQAGQHPQTPRTDIVVASQASDDQSPTTRSAERGSWLPYEASARNLITPRRSGPSRASLNRLDTSSRTETSSAELNCTSPNSSIRLSIGNVLTSWSSRSKSPAALKEPPDGIGQLHDVSVDLQGHDYAHACSMPRHSPATVRMRSTRPASAERRRGAFPAKPARRGRRAQSTSSVL